MGRSPGAPCSGDTVFMYVVYYRMDVENLVSNESDRLLRFIYALKQLCRLAARTIHKMTVDVVVHDVARVQSTPSRSNSGYSTLTDSP
jgi:hypothetical protein